MFDQTRSSSSPLRLFITPTSRKCIIRDLSKGGHAKLTSLRPMLPTTVLVLYAMLAPDHLSERQPPTLDKAETSSLLCSTARKLLSRKQLIGTKRHGQKLLQGHDGVLAQLVVHQYRRVGLQHLVSKTFQTCVGTLEIDLHRRTRG